MNSRVSCGFAPLRSGLVFDDHWLLLPPTVTDDPLGTPRAFRTRTNLWRDEPAVDPVLRGLAHNPAAPTDVLLGLLGAHGDALSDAFNRRADLPPVVVEAMLRHPSARVRAALAVNRYVDSAIRLRLVDDPDPRVVGALRADPDLALPDRVFTPEFDRLVRQFQRTLTTADELHCELIELMSKDRRSVPVAARHPEPRVRTAAVDRLGLLNEVKRDEVTQALLHDPVPEVRAAAVRYDVGLTRVHEPADLLSCNGYAYRGLLRERRLSRPLIAHVLAVDANDGGGGVSAMAGNRTLPTDVLDTLFEHPSSDARCSLAERDDLSRAQLTRLAADPDVAVRTAVSVHPRLTEDERAAIDIDVTTSREHRPFGPVEFSNRRDEHPWMRASTLPPLEQSVRWASSVNILLRRRAAADPRLPADLVETLAQDTDLGVRVLLAQHHPAAPSALLLRSFREYDGHGRARLLAMPNFPTTDLARLADDPDPAVRRLAARDPLAAPDLVERLAHDPDPGVRRAMAACPRLPVPLIVMLLDDPDLAEPAAANAALPVDTMRQRLAVAV
ncbi:HEAT repeat domain-containing protein [Catellatospora paridis]|uniref:HEAT repeat domain-containing protein n=1 Tax=Catellatospora paridis TaxID=1617086 RepID=UPI0012D41F86|nr:HEAT repeat domain-containing protein [Catellatospora paridis]